jgi:hypothetical protein
MKTIGVVLDSNYFLHFHSVEAIKWREFIEGQGNIILLVTPPVSGEIDKKKWSGKTEEERSRAKESTSKFKQWFHDQKLPALPNGISIEKVKYDSNISSSTATSPDDQLLEYCLQLRSKYDRILILTHDFGLQDRARDLGLEYLELPETDQRKSSLDPLKKELLEAQKELKNVKDRLPKVRVHFGDDEPIKKIPLPKAFTPLTDAEISKKVVEIQSNHPLHNFDKQDDGDKSVLVNGRSLFEIEKDKWDKYNSELQQFYSDYEGYLYKLNEHSDLVSRTIKIDLFVENYGSAPATEVYINLHFPVAENVRAFDQESFPSEPEQPRLPQKPMSMLEMMARGFGFNNNSLSSLLSERMLRSPNITPSNVSGLNIKKTRSFDIDFEIRSLKHHSSQAIESIYLTFHSAQEAKSFQIEWEAISDEMPFHDRGSLPVVFE